MKKILLFTLIILLTACSQSVKMRDLQFKAGERESNFYVYYEDKAFDGEAWSDDGKTFKIIVDCGIMKLLECFDEDGNLFCIFDCNDESEIYFNEKGNEISKEQARELYPDMYKHLENDILVEFSDIINQRIIERNMDDNPDVIEKELNDEVVNEAERGLSAAKLEISQIEEEVDNLFTKLIAAKLKLDNTNETLIKHKSGTDEYENAQKEKSMTTNEIKEIIDVINSKYAKYYGFQLTANQDTSLYDATRNKVKASIAAEVLKNKKQEALDRINEKYYGY